MYTKIIKWLSLNVAFLALIILGFYGGYQSAVIASYILAWFFIAISLLTTVDDVLDKIYESYSGRSVPESIDILYDIIVALAFILAGAPVTGIIYIAIMIPTTKHLHDEMIKRGYEE